MTLATRIRQAREAAQLSQAEFARAVGVSRATTSRWESGVIEQITFDKLAKISMITGKPVGWIVDDTYPAEFLHLARYLSKLSPDQVAAVEQLIKGLAKG